MLIKRNWIAALLVLSLVAFALAAESAVAQQIAPNPNPLGNTITVLGTGEFNDSGVSFANFGEIYIDWGAIFSNYGTLDNTGVINSYGQFDNYDALDNSGDANIYGPSSNYGTLTNSSNLYLTATFDNYATVTNDFYLENAGGILRNNSLSFLTNNDYVYNSGTIENNGTLANNGSFDNDNDMYNFDVLNNSGTLTNYGTLENYGTVTNTGTFVNNGTIDSTAGTFINSGPFATFSGSGDFIGDLVDTGTVAPGNSPSVLTIDGNWFKTDGSLEIELWGTFNGGGVNALTQFDWLNVSGNVDLAGILNVQLGNSILLGDGMSFVIVQVDGTLSGQFDGLAEGGIVGNFGGKDLFVTYNGGDGNDVVLFTSLSSIPEPSGLLLVAGMFGMCAIRGYRHRRASRTKLAA